jgi:Bacterial PH domain/Domain of unknown function (DUF1648)
LTWRAKTSVGWILSLLVGGLIVALDGWLLNRLLHNHVRAQEISFLSFLMGLAVLLSVPALLFLVYQTLSNLTLRYHLDRNGIFVRWAGTEQIIPIRDIQRIVPGRQFGDIIVRRRGPHWPGHERGVGLVPGIGRTCFLATQPLAGQLLLVTPGRSFAISPTNPEGFLRALASRQELGPNRLFEQERRPARWSTWSLWKDRTARILLGIALIVNLGLFGYLSALFPNLDIQLPLHFNRLGQVDRIGTKMELFALPIIGLIVLGTNVVLGLVLYKRERAGSYLLWGAAGAAQALFWLATFSIVP